MNKQIHQVSRKPWVLNVEVQNLNLTTFERRVINIFFPKTLLPNI